MLRMPVRLSARNAVASRQVSRREARDRLTRERMSPPESRRFPLVRTAVALLVVMLVAGLLPRVVHATGAASKLAFTTSPNSSTGGIAFTSQPVVKVEDSDGNIVTSTASITLAIKSGTGASGATLTCTGGNPIDANAGVASFVGCSIDKAGTGYKLTATSSGLTSVDSGSFDITVGAAAKVAFTDQPSGGTATVAFAGQPQVTVEDAGGNTVTTATGKIGLIVKAGTGTAGAKFTCTTNPVTISSGVATFAGCAIDKVGTGYMLTAGNVPTSGTCQTSPPCFTVDSSSFNITYGTATKLAFTTQPGGGGAGTAFGVQPVVTVQDAGGNTVANNGDSINLAVTSGTGAGTLSCTTDPLSATNGVATFAGCKIDKSGNGYTLTASDSASSLTATSAAFNVSAGGPASLSFTTQPSGGSGGQPFSTQPVVTIKDSAGNTVPGTGSITLSITSGTGTAGASLACVANPLSGATGVASFTGCNINMNGTGYRLTATDSTDNLTAVTSNLFDVSQGSATTLSFTAQPSGGTGGVAWPTQPVVALRDVGGNPASGTVTLSITTGMGTPGAALACTSTSVTASGGSATFSGCKIDKAGLGYTLTATLTSNTAVTTTSTSFSIAVGSPAQVAFTTQPSGATGGTVFATQPVVTVEDSGGNRVQTSVANVSLSISSGTGNGTLTCTDNALPANFGIVAFEHCKIDAAAAAYTLTATDSTDSLSGTSAPFAVTVGAATKLAFTTQPSGGVAGSSFATQPVVSVEDAGGNRVTGNASSIALSITSGSGASGAALSCSGGNPVGASAGAATFFGCSINTVAAGYRLTATDSADGLSGVSTEFSVTLAAPVPLGTSSGSVPLAQTFGGRHYAQNATAVADNVNSATGEYTFAVTDINVAGIGVPFLLQRQYNSADTAGGAFGPGWSSLFDLSVQVSGGTATVRGEDGQRVVFTSDGAGGWTAPPGARVTLQCTGANCTVTRFDNVTWHTANGQVQDYLAPTGQGLHFTYSGGQLASVSVAASSGTPTISITEDGSGHVTRVASPSRSLSYAYNGSGLLTSYTDVRGSSWSYTYDGSGRLNRVTDPLGHLRNSVTYGENGRVTAASQMGSPQRFNDTFTWNAGSQSATRFVSTNVGGTVLQEPYVDQYRNNVLIGQQFPNGATVGFSYDSSFNLTELQDPMGWVQLMTYSAAGDLLTQSTPVSAGVNAVVHMTYDASHRMTALTDANGNTTSYFYSGANLVRITPPGPSNGGIPTMQYNSLGLLVSQTAANNAVTAFYYDAAGNLTNFRVHGVDGQALNGLGPLTSYDEAGDKVTAVDPRGNTNGTPAGVNPAFQTTWTYDAAGNLLSMTKPGNGTASSTYDAAGQVASSTDANGLTTTYSWNEGTATRTTSSTAGTGTQVYDAAGNLLSQTDPGGATTTNGYDAAGRQVSSKDPANVVLTFTFDLTGNVVGLTDSNGTTITRQFDAANRLIRDIVNGNVNATGYDLVGNVVTTVNPAGVTTTYTYTSHNKVASATTSAGTTTFNYDIVDNLIRRTDPNGHFTSYTYDGANRRRSMTINGNTSSYAYDVADNLTNIADPDGRTTTNTWNAANKLTSVSYNWANHPGTASTVTYQYDGLGRRTQMTDATGTHTYSYDAGGDLTRVQSGSDVFSYDYSHGGQIGETYPDGTAVTYKLDDAHNLMSVTAGQSGQPGYVNAAYIRNPARLVTGIAYSNGVLTTQQWDQSNNLVNQNLQLAGSQIANTSYTYDAAGDRLSMTTNSGGSVVTNSYGYDGNGRLTGFSTQTAQTQTLNTDTASPALSARSNPLDAVLNLPYTGVSGAASQSDVVSLASAQTAAPAYTYDGVGNRLSSVASGTTYTYDASDALTSQSGPGGAVSYTYDKNGNLTSLTSSGLSETFSYDAANHLVGVTKNASGQVTTISYTYDGDGNRVSKTVNGAVTQYLWDIAANYPLLAIERTGGGSLIRRYIYGDGPVAVQTPTQTFFYHLDSLGSITQLTDSTGHIVASYNYDGFGNATITASGTPPVNPLQFQGQYLDPDTGLYYMRARNYDPTTGRFTQRDPIQPIPGAAAVSSYVFVGDQPTTHVDPAGTTTGVANTVLFGHSTTNANIAQDTKYAVILLKVGLAAGAQIALASGSIAAGSEAAENLKFAGGALAVVAIGLQAYLTVEDCEHGTVAQCVGDSVGLAFAVGCAVLTEGAGAVACGIAGAALGFIITEWGPQIADGIVQAYNYLAPKVLSHFDGSVANFAINVVLLVGCAALTAGVGTLICGTVIGLYGPQIAAFTIQAYNYVADQVSYGYQVAVGALTTGFNDAVSGLVSGFNVAVATLASFGYSAVQLANVLANTFSVGYHDAVNALISLGYDIQGVGQALETVFNQTAAQVGEIFKDGYNYTVNQISSALKTIYNLADVGVATILSGLNYGVDEISSGLKTAYNDTAAALATVLNGLNYTVNQIASGLQTAYNLADQGLATVLKGLNYTADQIAGALLSVYHDADQLCATILNGLNFTVNQIAGALQGVYRDAEHIAGVILQGLNYTADQIAGVFKNVYNDLDSAAAAFLQGLNYSVDVISAELKSLYSDGEHVLGVILQGLNYTVNQIAGEFKTLYGDAEHAVGVFLQGLNYGVNQIAGVFESVYNDVASTAASLLQGLSYTANQIAGALQSVFNQIDSAVASILNGLGYAANVIAGALQSVYNDAAQAVASILQGLSYDASVIAGALESAYSLAADAVSSILKSIGEAASDIANALTSVFNMASSDIANLLSSIGFDNSTIDAIGGAFTDFGNDVSNFFCSLFC